MPRWKIKLKRSADFEAIVEAETQEAAEDKVLLRAPGDIRSWRVVDAVQLDQPTHRPASETTQKGAISFL